MYYGISDVAKKMAGLSVNTSELRPSEFWALDDVSFEVARGETLGIMGANGSGKSTLLRVLTGIFPPDKGTISIRGRVGALIAVGAGFHPHMTGRENIFLNGTILGMRPEEIKKNFDSIIDFAEISEFIDAPVSTYSSGMYVRLGFAIAIHCNPDIVIADEILSVGDYMFQMKCFDKIREVLRNGTSVLLVSHSEIAIRSICDRVAILHRNKLVDTGRTDDMIIKYRSIVINEVISEKQKIEHSSPFEQKAGVSTTGLVVIKSFDILDRNNELVRSNKKELKKIPYSITNEIHFVMDIDVLSELENCRLAFYIRDLGKSDLVYVCGVGISSASSEKLTVLKKGARRISFKMDISGLTPNVYTVVAGVGDAQFHIKFHGILDETDTMTFEIIASPELKEADVILNRPYYVPNYSFDIQ